MTPTENIVGQVVDGTTGKIVTQHVPKDQADLYLLGAAQLAANGIRDMAPVRKLVRSKLKVQEPRQGKAVEG